LFKLIEVWFPNHYDSIITARCEVISRRRKVYWVCCSLMTIQSVKNMSLSEIPDFDSGIVWTANEVSSIRMECDWTNAVVVSIVMLN
jgi:uncharacterized metal-binding protein